MAKLIDENQVLNMVLNEGMKPLYVAKKLSVGAQRIYNILVKNGYEEFIPMPDKNIINRIIELYQTGYCVNEIVKLVNCPKYTATYVLKLNGINVESCFHRNRENKIDHTFFNTIDTERKAYWLGLMYADGYNSYSTSKYQMELTLEETDAYLLEELKKDLKTVYSISPKQAKLSKGGIGYYKRLTFYSKDLSQALKKHGCPETKSHILKFPTSDMMPNHLIRHFIRGYFDGDGSISWKPDKNKYISPFNFQGTKDFVTGIQKTLVENTKMAAGSIEKGHGEVWSWRSGGRQQALKFMDFIYKDATIFLQRKYDKFKDIQRLVNAS